MSGNAALKQLKVGVVGAGILGSRHARVFHEHPETQLVAVADLDLGRAQAAASRFQAAAYKTADEMIEAECPDIVAVATPDFAHAGPVLAALAAGAHVFVEKPLTTNLGEAVKIVEEAGRVHRTVMVNYSQRFVTDFAWIKERIRNGEIGEPRMIQSEKFDTIYVPTTMIGWAARTSPFFFMTSHDLDLVCWYLESEPVEVYAQEVKGVLKDRGIDVHDGVQAILRFKSGASAFFHSSWIHPETYPAVAGGSLEIIGSGGFIRYSMVERRAHLYTPNSSQIVDFGGPHTADEWRGQITGAFVASVNHFLESVRSGREPMASARQTLHVTRTQCAVEESIRADRVVKMV